MLKSWALSYRTETSTLFSLKGQKVHVLGFVGHMVSITTFPFCFTKAAAVNGMEMNEPSAILVKFYLQK